MTVCLALLLVLTRFYSGYSLWTENDYSGISRLLIILPARDWYLDEGLAQAKSKGRKGHECETTGEYSGWLFVQESLDGDCEPVTSWSDNDISISCVTATTATAIIVTSNGNEFQ